MYCAVCGTLINAKLNFCNRCGTKVSKVDLEIQKTVTENLSSSLGYIGGFGFLGFMFVIYILVKNDVPSIALTAISLFYLAALFGVCYQIVQRVSNLPGNSAPSKNDFQDDSPPAQIVSANTAQLESASLEPPSSVTDITTRTLDKELIRR
ncbi:MAG: hypothetical protein H0T08_00415 [Acidobacteria bacterium]|jgi:hypothetical protein|nr:hypothetical protein [Acidobacteriota bacterium]